MSNPEVVQVPPEVTAELATRMAIEDRRISDFYRGADARNVAEAIADEFEANAHRLAAHLDGEDIEHAFGILREELETRIDRLIDDLLQEAIDELAAHEADLND